MPCSCTPYTYDFNQTCQSKWPIYSWQTCVDKSSYSEMQLKKMLLKVRRSKCVKWNDKCNWPPGSQYVLCLWKKYAAAAQLIKFKMKNRHFILNENHSWKQHMLKWSMSEQLQLVVSPINRTQLHPKHTSDFCEWFLQTYALVDHDVCETLLQKKRHCHHLSFTTAYVTICCDYTISNPEFVRRSVTWRIVNTSYITIRSKDKMIIYRQETHKSLCISWNVVNCCKNN